MTAGVRPGMHSKMDRLVAKLRANGTVEQHLDERRRRWQQDLRGLLTGIEQWLAPVIAEGLLRVERSEIQVEDVVLGSYEADMLTLHMNGVKGYLLPRMENRVSFTVGASQASLIQGLDGWVVCPIDDREGGLRGTMPLHEDALVELLLVMLG